MIFLIVFFISIIFIAIFAAFEIAYISTERSYIGVELPKKLSSFLIGYPERVLTTDLIGTNIFSVTAAISLTNYFMKKIISTGEAAFIAATVTTVFILIAGEIFPKAYARSHPHKITKRFSYLIYLTYQVSLPFVYIFSQLSRLLSSTKERGLTPKEELELLILRGLEERLLKEKDAKILLFSLRLYEKRAFELMVPIHEVFSLPADMPLSKFRGEVRRSGKDRILVYEENLDNIIGVVHIKDLCFSGEKDISSVRDLLKPVAFVYMNWTLEKILKEMRRNSTSVAVVIDEFGGVLGAISAKDLLFSLIGTISDTSGNNEIILIPGNTRFEELESMGFYEKADPDSTVSAFLLEKMGKIPQKGETYKSETLSYTIADADERGIKKVLLKKINDKNKS